MVLPLVQRLLLHKVSPVRVLRLVILVAALMVVAAKLVALVHQVTPFLLLDPVVVGVTAVVVGVEIIVVPVEGVFDFNSV